MKAFRYFSSHWFETLRDRRFKLAKPSELNDPFDCVLTYSGKPSRKNALEVVLPFVVQFETKQEAQGISRVELERQHDALVERLIEEYLARMLDAATLNTQTKKNADKAIRLLCVSAALDTMMPEDHLAEVLLWSHYANKHRGVRIGLDLESLKKNPNLKLCPADYRPDRPTHDLGQEMTKEVVLDTIRIKSSAWAYEKEMRLWTSPERCPEETLPDGTSASFLQITPDAIWRFDFGLSMPVEEQAKCLAILERDYPHTEVYKAVYHSTQYALKYERLR